VDDVRISCAYGRRVKVWRIAICLGAVLLGAAAIIAHRGASLPRIKLPDGGEFRVLQVGYGTEHRLGGAPPAIHWVWDHLPLFLRAQIRQPPLGTSGVGSDKAALSIWWGWFDRATGKPLLGPSDNAVMSLDSGERINLGWPEPVDDYRQIFIIDPPRHSRVIRFHVVTNDERVDFAIKNPAFDERAAGPPTAVFKMAVEREAAAESQIECVAVGFPDPIRAPNEGGDFEIEYTLTSQFSADLWLAVEPIDHLAHDFRDSDWFTHKHLPHVDAASMRYALLKRRESPGSGLVRFHSCKRRALISLPKSPGPCGLLFLTVPVDGYFRDSGQTFHGSIDAILSVVPKNEAQ
jgi:hypothetical protein